MPNFTWIISSGAFCFCHSLAALPSALRISLQIPPGPTDWSVGCPLSQRGSPPQRANPLLDLLEHSSDIDYLSVANCTLPAIKPHTGPSEHLADGTPLSSDWLVNSVPLRQQKCLRMIDSHCPEVYLFSVFLLGTETGITFKECELPWAQARLPPSCGGNN